MDRQQEFVLRTLEERDIRFVRLWFTDVLGTLKSVSVAPAELESAFEEGMGIDGSAIEGFARVYESDMVAMPDPTTFQVFPFEGGADGESAAFFDGDDPLKLSKTARAFIAGLLTHAREYTAVTNQWVNSYKRLFPMQLPDRITESPAFVSWGHLNRSALVRVPAFGKPNSARVEVRSLDSAANPYLAFAVLLGAGLKGIEEGYELPPGAEDDVWSLTNAERKAMGYDTLPENLAEAIDVMSGSELIAEVLGEHVFDFFLRNKRAEWEQYRREVTPYERQRYLGAL